MTQDSAENEARVIDLDRESWRSLCEAASQSNWMPPEYMMNDWVSDCAEFLRNGPQALQPSPLSGDADDRAHLLAEVGRLLEALEPFAREANHYEIQSFSRKHEFNSKLVHVRLGDLRAARAALESKTHG